MASCSVWHSQIILLHMIIAMCAGALQHLPPASAPDAPPHYHTYYYYDAASSSSSLSDGDGGDSAYGIRRTISTSRLLLTTISSPARTPSHLTNYQQRTTATVDGSSSSTANYTAATAAVLAVLDAHSPHRGNTYKNIIDMLASSSKSARQKKSKTGTAVAGDIRPPPSSSSGSVRPATPAALPAVVESQASFALYYATNFKVVQNLFYNYTYLLLPQGSEEEPYRYRGRDWEANVTAFQHPLANYTLATSSAAGFLQLLGCLDKLRGVAASFSAASPCVSEMLGRIPTVVDDPNAAVNPTVNIPSSSSSSDPPPAAAIISTNDSSSSSSSSNNDNSTNSSSSSNSTNSSSSNIINDNNNNSSSNSSSSSTSVVNFDAVFSSPDSPTYASDLTYLSNFISFDAPHDHTPLQRAEWIKFIAAFFDMEATANSIYSQIESNYKCVSANALTEAAIYYGSNSPSPPPPSSSSSEGGSESGGGGNNNNGSSSDTAGADYGRRRRPTVGWLRFQQGLWSFSDTPYKLQFILDAGGLNLDENILSMTFDVSNESDMSYFYNVSSTLDVAIDETYASDPSTYTFDTFVASTNFTDTSGIPFLWNKRLWRYDKRVGLYNALDWSEGAIAQPQVVLRDLVDVLHPNMTNIDGYNNTTYFRNIALGESVLNTTSMSCLHDITSLAQLTIISCPTQSKKN